MTPTLITAKNGKARPKNPYEGSSQSASFLYATFEDTVQWHDCPEATEDGEYTAYLQWQCQYDWNNRQWMDVSDEWYEDMKDATANKYQRIWRIVPQPQEKNLSLKASMKFDRLIHNKPKPDGNNKGELLGHFVYDHEKQTETFIPVTQKEETKTVEGKIKFPIEAIRPYILPIYEKWKDGNNMMSGFDAMVESYLAGYNQQNTAMMEENTRLNDIIVEKDDIITELKAKIDTLITGLP